MMMMFVLKPYFLLFTGQVCVLGEALALTKSDIDIEKRTININKSFSRINKEDLITPPKTPKSNRKISIHKELADLLNEYINKLPYLADDERLFNLSKVTARQSLYKYAKKAGVKQIRIHDLRHSHASLLVELGFSPLLIAQRLGHEKKLKPLCKFIPIYFKQRRRIN